MKQHHRGRRKSIPESYYVRVLRWKIQGEGYGAISERLSRLGVATSRGSVERLVKGLPPYQENAEYLTGTSSVGAIVPTIDLERLTKPLLEQKARADDGTTYGQESLMYVCPALISNP